MKAAQFIRACEKDCNTMSKNKTGPKLGTGGKRNKLRICLTADVEAFLRRDGDTIGTAVETSVRKSAAFRRWLTTQQ